MKNTMITTAILSIIILLALTALTGCRQQKYPETPAAEQPAAETTTPETPAEEAEALVDDTPINPITKEPYHDIEEKRGYKTNITEFNELLRRASTIKSYKYNITDTGISDEEYQFFVLGRFIKVRLPELRNSATGDKYDEVFMDRVTKTAFLHCSYIYCPKPNLDKEIEKTEYSDHYISDPMEYLYKTVVNPEYLREEMLGNDYTKVFKITFEDDPGKIWLQEYYGYPLKIEVNQKDGKTRKINFNDMMVDATARGEIDLPYNFTVKGEGNKTWVFWEHYLGEWPKKGQQLTPELKAQLGL
jgi:predicted small lipoprotein YifL